MCPVDPVGLVTLARTVVVFVLAMTSVAHAQLYTDEAAFLAALNGPATTLDFDDMPALTLLDEQYAGVDFDDTGVLYDEVNNPSGGDVFSAPNVLLNSAPPLPIVFTFDAPMRAVGFYNTSIADREEVTMFDEGGGVVFVGQLPEGPVNFLGYVSATPIARVSVVGIPPQTFGTIFIDQLTFEPASTCQDDKGFGGPGSAHLSVCGDLLASGGLATILLETGTPGQPAILFASLDCQPTPFKGGQLVTLPVLLQVSFTLGAAGDAQLPAPGGGGPLTVVLQAIHADPDAPLGVGISNAVELDLLP